MADKRLQSMWSRRCRNSITCNNTVIQQHVCRIDTSRILWYSWCLARAPHCECFVFLTYVVDNSLLTWEVVGDRRDTNGETDPAERCGVFYGRLVDFGYTINNTTASKCLKHHCFEVFDNTHTMLRTKGKNSLSGSLSTLKSLEEKRQ